MNNLVVNIETVTTELQKFCKELAGISLTHANNKNRWHYGPIYFTRREVQTLSLYLRGCRSKQIAYSLSISDKTVDTHLRNIKDKIEAENRYQIVQRAIQLGFIDLMFQSISE